MNEYNIQLMQKQHQCHSSVNQIQVTETECSLRNDKLHRNLKFYLVKYFHSKK